MHDIINGATLVDLPGYCGPFGDETGDWNRSWVCKRNAYIFSLYSTIEELERTRRTFVAKYTEEPVRRNLARWITHRNAEVVRELEWLASDEGHPCTCKQPFPMPMTDCRLPADQQPPVREASRVRIKAKGWVTAHLSE